MRPIVAQSYSLSFRLFKWFGSNHMKADHGKSHIFLFKKKTEKMTIDNVVKTSCVEEKLLGITLDSELKFEKHSTDICNKPSLKVHMMSRFASYMSLDKRRRLGKRLQNLSLTVALLSMPRQ